MDTSETNRTTPGNQSVKASSTLGSAFTSVFNLFMIGAFTIYVFAGIYLFLAGGFEIGLLLLILFSTSFVFLYIWAILTRSFEINETGIVYREAFRTVVIKWDEMDSIHIESWKGQITFWVRGKLTRIHTFGLRSKELAFVQEAFLDQIKARGIILK